MYKIKAKKTGLGYEVTLLKKWLLFWIPNTICTIPFCYIYKANEVIEEWKQEFNIPSDRVIINY